MSQSNEFMQYILDRTTERIQQGQVLLLNFSVLNVNNNGYLVVMEIYSHTNIDESSYSKRVARKRVLPPMFGVYSSRTLLQAFRSNCCIRKFLKLFRISIVSIKKKGHKGENKA